jgi:hypothetical protein
MSRKRHVNTKTAELNSKEEYKKYKNSYLDDVSKVEKDYIKALENMEIKLLGKENEK